MNTRNSMIALALLLIGGLLVYAGIKNKHPADLVKLALTGQDISQAKPLAPDQVKVAPLVQQGLQGLLNQQQQSTPTAPSKPTLTV